MNKEYRLKIFFLWLNLGFFDFHFWKWLKVNKPHAKRLCIKPLEKSIPFTSHYYSNAYFLKYKILYMRKLQIVLYTKCQGFFSVKGLMINIFGFVDYTISVTMNKMQKQP